MAQVVAHPQSLFHLFLFFQKAISTILQQIILKNQFDLMILEQKSLLLAFIPSKDPALLNIRSLLGASHPKILHPALAPNLRIPTTAALSIPGLPTPTSIPSAAVSAAGTSLWAAAARRWHDDGP